MAPENNLNIVDSQNTPESRYKRDMHNHAVRIWDTILNKKKNKLTLQQAVRKFLQKENIPPLESYERDIITELEIIIKSLGLKIEDYLPKEPGIENIVLTKEEQKAFDDAQDRVDSGLGGIKLPE